MVSTAVDKEHVPCPRSGKAMHEGLIRSARWQRRRFVFLANFVQRFAPGVPGRGALRGRRLSHARAHTRDQHSLSLAQVVVSKNMSRDHEFSRSLRVEMPPVVCWRLHVASEPRPFKDASALDATTDPLRSVSRLAPRGRPSLTEDHGQLNTSWRRRWAASLRLWHKEPACCPPGCPCRSSLPLGSFLAESQNLEAPPVSRVGWASSAIAGRRMVCTSAACLSPCGSALGRSFRLCNITQGSSQCGGGARSAPECWGGARRLFA